MLAYAGTWLTLLPVVLSKNGIGLLPYDVPFAVFAVLFILSGLLGPTLSAIVMTGATEGKAGVRRLLRRYMLWRVGVQWWLLVLFGYVALYLLSAVPALGAAPLSALAQKWPLLFASYLPAVLTFNLVTALGEEPGWRGFALPRLQTQYGPVVGSLILGTLHAGWHLPVFFLPALGFGHFTVSFFVTWIPAVWATTLVWTWIFNNTKGSILIAILLHSAFDAAGSFVFLTLLKINTTDTGITGPISAWQLGLYIAWAVLVLIATRGRLSYKREQTAAVSLPDE
jgi:membrane protease YdiL (CAAX protease family)